MIIKTEKEKQMTEEFIQKEKDLIQALLRFKEAVMWMNRAVENPEKPGRHS